MSDTDDNSVPDSRTLNAPAESNSAKMTEKVPNTQVTRFKGLNMAAIRQMLQTIAQKSCSQACHLFCIPWQEKALTKSPASAVLILNISNSTLIDCVIGDSQLRAAPEQLPLMQDLQQQDSAQVRCICQQVAAPPHPPGEHTNINIHSSRLNCVIIGDNNCMEVEQGGRLE